MPVCIQPDHDKEHNGESKKGGSSITDKRERNTNYGRKPDRHTNINSNMKKQNGSHPISITTAENTSLPFCNHHDPHEQEKINTQQNKAADKAKPFSNSAKNKIRSLFRNKIKPGLCSFKKLHPGKSAASNGNLTLSYIIIIISFSLASLLPSLTTVFWPAYDFSGQ